MSNIRHYSVAIDALSTGWNTWSAFLLPTVGTKFVPSDEGIGKITGGQLWQLQFLDKHSGADEYRC